LLQAGGIDEQEALKSSLPFLSSMFRVRDRVYPGRSPAFDPKRKAGQASPMRPAIYVEGQHMLTLELKSQAAEDLRYLLNRGYTRESAVRFVGDRFALGEAGEDSALPVRHPSRGGEAPLIQAGHARAYPGETAGVDGFNIMWTIYWAINGHPLLLCDHGVVRDITVARAVLRREGRGWQARSPLGNLCALPLLVCHGLRRADQQQRAVSAYLNERLLSSESTAVRRRPAPPTSRYRARRGGLLQRLHRHRQGKGSF
jgi:hypothetical protein